MAINTDFQVIIMGANYAGLAAAGELRGKRVLLLDRNPIGGHQASTCAMWKNNVDVLGANHAVLQTLHSWYIHIGEQTLNYATPEYPICVLDHSLLCQYLFARSGAVFRREVIQSVAGNEVITNHAHYRAPIIIEALGWQGLRKREEKRRGLTLAMETELPIEAKDFPLESTGLHVYFSPWRWGAGGGWVFPSGPTTRVGFGRFNTAGKIDNILKDLLEDYDQTVAPRRYGNYIPWRLRESVIDGRYIIGDAAGQCLGFVGEGIRSAMYFGMAAARCANDVLDQRISSSSGLYIYQRFVTAHRFYFGLFSFLQIILPRLSKSWLIKIARWLESNGLGTKVLYWYARIFDIPALMKSPSIDRNAVLFLAKASLQISGADEA
jgi:flavin-dependent dehydrogenase